MRKGIITCSRLAQDEHKEDNFSHKACESFTSRIEDCLCLSTTGALCVLRVVCDALKRNNESQFRCKLEEFTLLLGHVVWDVAVQHCRCSALLLTGK